MNEYTKIANYYDLLVTSGYYNYEKLAQEISKFLKVEQNTIEIGVGTGLLLEKLLKINPNYNLTGMDHTPEMLEIGKERLGDRVKLFQADIISASIPCEYDLAISNGGLCAFVDTGSNFDLYTHLVDDDSNLQALKNISNCIKTEGLFLINIQGLHENYDKPLGEGVVYSQQISVSTTHKDCIHKTFSFKKGDEILAQEHLMYRIFKGKAIEDLFNEAGFQFKEQSQNFFIYSKK